MQQKQYYQSFVCIYKITQPCNRTHSYSQHAFKAVFFLYLAVYVSVIISFEISVGRK